MEVMLNWQVIRWRIALQKLPYSCQCLAWLSRPSYGLQITHMYSGTKAVATTLELWNWEQAALDWTKGECNQHVSFTSLRWDYYSQVKN